MKKIVKLTEDMLREMVRKAISEELSRTDKTMLKEYHEQLRIPFEEYGYGHAFIDEFIDWIQYSSKKGMLPKPSITWEEGLKKGWDEYTSKGKKTKWENYDDFRKYIKYCEDSGDIEFDENGNLYVERSITIYTPNEGINSEYEEFFDNQIRNYEKNVGGCWAVGHNNSKPYCGNIDDVNIILKGYMFLDDIYWEEFVRLWNRGVSEFEARTYPNGRVMLTEIYFNRKVLKVKDFDGPRVLKSTFFGNNETFNGDFAKLGYENSGYDKSYIDRQGNEYTEEEFLKKIGDFLKNGYDLGYIINFYSDDDNDPTMICVWGEYYNFIDKDRNLLFPERWFNHCSTFKYGKAIIEIGKKHNLIDRNGNILFEPNNPDKWFDDIEKYNGNHYFYKLRKGNQVYFITNDDKFMDFETGVKYFIDKGCTLENLFGRYSVYKVSDVGLYCVSLGGYMLLVREDGTLVTAQLFNSIYNFRHGLSMVKMLNKKYNFIDENGNMLYEADNPKKWFDQCEPFGDNNFAIIGKFDEHSFLHKYSLLDKNGNIIYEPDNPEKWFDKIDEKKLKYFYVVHDERKCVCNFISKDDGRLLFPNMWFSNFSVFDYKFGIYSLSHNRKYNFMNENGNILYEPDNPEKWFDRYKQLNGNFIVISINNRWNLMDFNGNIPYEPNNPEKWFDNMFKCSKDCTIVDLNGYQNYLDINGNIIYEPDNPEKWFDKCDPFIDGMGLVQKNGKKNIITKVGKLLLPNLWFDGYYGYFNGYFRVRINGVAYNIDKNGNFYDINTKQPIPIPTGNNVTNESILRLKNKIRHFVNEAILRYTNKADL